ncbi:MAG: FadR family transcriptional regulator [Candidatus Accumulibacter sp.]|jgi:GntR family galactonate operon transcriptional repressor|nr:FadR family transcriptional regulator [Accumulibacter sp.]
MTKTERLFRLFGKQIAQGDYAPGAALPSEAELCKRFDVSRNVMREIIKMLSSKRLIDAQAHRGLFVMPGEQWNYLDADVLAWVLEKEASPALVRSLSEVRSLIEPAISRWAAERATAVDLVDIEASFNKMAASRENAAAFHAADILFHRAVLAASHNLVIGQLSDAVGALQRAIFDFTFRTGAEHLELTVDQHLDLFDAIRRKNPDAAEAASRRMVKRTADRALAVLDEAEASR